MACGLAPEAGDADVAVGGSAPGVAVGAGWGSFLQAPANSRATRVTRLIPSIFMRASIGELRRKPAPNRPVRSNAAIVGCYGK